MQRMIYLSTKEAGNDHNKKTFAGSSGGTQKPWEQMGKGHFRMQPCSTFDCLVFCFFLDLMTHRQYKSLKSKNYNYKRDANKDSHTVWMASGEQKCVLLQCLQHHGDFQQHPTLSALLEPPQNRTGQSVRSCDSKGAVDGRMDRWIDGWMDGTITSSCLLGGQQHTFSHLFCMSLLAEDGGSNYSR